MSCERRDGGRGNGPARGKGRRDSAKKKRIVSENWMVVNKNDSVSSAGNDDNDVAVENVTDNVAAERRNASGAQNGGAASAAGSGSNDVISNGVLTKLRPFVPMTVEEVSVTRNLDKWSNSNVRLIGAVKLCGDGSGAYCLESVGEAGGPYRVRFDSRHLEALPLLDERIQAFGEIKLEAFNGNAEPVVRVSFYRNVEFGDLTAYAAALDRMRTFVPLFIKTDYESRTPETESDDEIDEVLLF